MGTWPQHVERAGMAIYYGGTHAEFIEDFQRRWGGLTEDILHRAIHEGEGEDKLFAVFAIGYTATPLARQFLLPFLHSNKAQVRWASAICLGKMQEEAAFSILLQMLEAGQSPQTFSEEEKQEWERNGHWYGFQQLTIARLLGGWGRSSVVPLLRQTLIKSWELEQQSIGDWQPHYQKALAEALGQLGAFGAFMGLQVSPMRLQMLLMYLAYGSLQAHNHARERRALEGVIIDNNALKEELAAILEQRFGLSLEEQASCVDVFERMYLTGEELL